MNLRWKRLGVWLVAACGFASPSAHGGLDEYVKRPDPAFAWKVLGRETSDAGTVVRLELTSQVWQGITWTHRLRVYEPKTVTYPAAVLLFITGGSTTSQVKPDDHAFGFKLAKLAGARVAVLPQVPNQPLLGGKTEDTLIAETFVRYLESRDESWPLLFPMVKSAVAAMDAVQAWSKQEGRPAVARFVVTGASKRGWTTWLTGAVDPRVIGIAPMVIVTLNMKAQNANQLTVWGKYSEQIDDYTQRGLMDRLDEPTRHKLWTMVDPYFYRDRLTMPKLLINGTNDRYWTLNALDLYWDDLQGPKNVLYLPNAGHGLDQNRDYALTGLGAFFRLTADGQLLPRVESHAEKPFDGTLRLTIASTPAPVSARIWTARTATHDFRESRWEPSPLEVGQTMTASAPAPERGHVALLADLVYEYHGLTYHLSTPIVERGAKAGE